MEKIFLIGISLLSLIGAGAVGATMSDQDWGMMQGYNWGLGFRGCPMINDEELHSMHEQCEEHMEEYCKGLNYEECKEMHKECEEQNYIYCEHETGEGEEGRHSSCPMMVK